jgi:hypothetical protein
MGCTCAAVVAAAGLTAPIEVAMTHSGELTHPARFVSVLELVRC